MPWAQLVARSGASHPEQTQDSQVPSLGFRKSVRSPHPKERIQARICGHQILPAKWKLPSLPISVKADSIFLSQWKESWKWRTNNISRWFKSSSYPKPSPWTKKSWIFLGPFCSKYLSGTSGKLFLNTPRGNLANTTKKNTMLKEIDMLFGSSCIDDVLKTYGEIFFCSLQSENGMKRALY